MGEKLQLSDPKVVKSKPYLENSSQKKKTASKKLLEPPVKEIPDG